MQGRDDTETIRIFQRAAHKHIRHRIWGLDSIQFVGRLMGKPLLLVKQDSFNKNKDKYVLNMGKLSK